MTVNKINSWLIANPALAQATYSMGVGVSSRCLIVSLPIAGRLVEIANFAMGSLDPATGMPDSPVTGHPNGAIGWACGTGDDGQPVQTADDVDRIIAKGIAVAQRESVECR